MGWVAQARGLLGGARALLQGGGLRDLTVVTRRPALGLELCSVLRATGQLDERIAVGASRKPVPEAVLAEHRRKVAGAVAVHQGALRALLAAPGLAVGLAVGGWLGMELVLSEVAAAGQAAAQLWSQGRADPLLWHHLGLVAWGWLRPVVDALLLARAVAGLRRLVRQGVQRWVRGRLGLG